MKAFILAAAALAMAPAATFAHGLHLSIGLGGISISTGGYARCEPCGPRYVAPPAVYVEPAVTYVAPPPPPLVYAAPPVYVAPPAVVYAEPRVYAYPVAPAGYYYGYGRWGR